MITRKIGRNRGKKRLWLEGKVLSENGFPHGTRYLVSIGPKSICIMVTTNPLLDRARTVAGTPERPIIDINSDKILIPFTSKVEIAPGKDKGFYLLITEAQP